jgi:hypothetical protein
LIQPKIVNELFGVMLTIKLAISPVFELLEEIEKLFITPGNAPL